jgi:hypothetical protein
LSEHKKSHALHKEVLAMRTTCIAVGKTIGLLAALLVPALGVVHAAEVAQRPTWHQLPAPPCAAALRCAGAWAPAYELARSASLATCFQSDLFIAQRAASEGNHLRAVRAPALTVVGPTLAQPPCLACRPLALRGAPPSPQPIAGPLALEPGEPAEAVLELMEHVAPSVIVGSVFDADTPDNADRETIVQSIRAWQRDRTSEKPISVWDEPIDLDNHLDEAGKLQALREASRQLELLAYRLEDELLYSQADRLRALAAQLRTESRRAARFVIGASIAPYRSVVAE